MSDPVLVDRLQFTLAVTFHYLFPITTMGLALFIVWLKSVAYFGGRRRGPRFLHRPPDEAERYETGARFWAKIFGIAFAVGVVTGIPLEFQFGTNWAQFSHYAGGVIGQTLAMEGVFAFFAESVFLGVFLWGRSRVSPGIHWLAAVLVWVGSWVSGFFIIATNAWMQHPVAYSTHQDRLQLTSLGSLLTNAWLPWEYLHNMSGAAVTGAFVLAGMGALYLLLDRHHDVARIFLKVGVTAAFVFSVLQIFPTGDRHAHLVAHNQPATFAAMEGLFRSERGAPLVIIGNPDTQQRRLEATVEMPHALSFLTSRNWNERLTGLNEIPTNRWPDSVPLVYYAYHIMVGLGTIFVVLAGLAAVLLYKGRLYASRRMLWALMLTPPFAYIANIAGWTVAETGRQPWVVYGLQRTHAGASPAESVPSGTAIFTLLGFAGLYLLVFMLAVLLVARIIARGPVDDGLPRDEPPAVASPSPS